MTLTGRQKKYLKKNLRKKPLTEIAADLNVSPEEIKNYLSKKWKKDKLKKIEGRESKARKKTLSANIAKDFSFKHWWRQNRFFLTLLFLLIIAAYINTLNNEFVSDDVSGILQNNQIGHIDHILNNPFSFFYQLIRFLIVNLFGKNPLPFHLINILFHLGTTFLVYLIALLFLSPAAAFFSATLFAIHPLLTEAVTWISGGYYVYSAFLVLFSFFFYLLSQKEKKLWWLSIILYFLALATSEKTISFPLILFFYEVSFGQIKKNWRKILPYFFLSLLWGGYLLGAMNERLTALRNDFYQQIPQSPSSLEKKLITLVMPAIIGITSYLFLLLWPDKLTLYHSEMAFTQGEILIRVMIIFAIIALIIWSYKKEKRVFFCLSFFLIALSPTLTPFRVSWIVAERYVYLASAGIFILLGIIIEKLTLFTNQRTLPWIILLFLVPPLMIRTIIRNNDWQNQDTLWLAAAKTSPSSPQNHNNLGDLWARRGDYQKAIEEFQTAIKLNPRYADAYHNLANVYWKKGETDLAIKNYQKALEINPRLWQSHQNLAAIYFAQEKFNLSEKHLRLALKINPDNPKLHANLAIVLLKLNKKREAQEEVKIAIKLDPQNPEFKQLLPLTF